MFKKKVKIICLPNATDAQILAFKMDLNEKGVFDIVVVRGPIQVIEV
jgi:hypothetical protein